MRQPILYTSLFAALLIFGCGDDATTDTPADTEDAGADTGGDTAGEDTTGTPDTSVDAAPDVTADAVEDVDPTIPDPECEVNWLVWVDGEITDESGSPLERAMAQLCVRLGLDGNLVCLQPSPTDAEGHFRIEAPPSARCVNTGSMRVLLPNTDRATTYCHIEPPEGMAELVLDTPIVLFETTPVDGLPAYGDPTQSRTVAFDGIEVEVVPERIVFDQATYDRLAAARVDPSDESLCFLGEDERPDALWAFSPELNVADAHFDARFANDLELAPGTIVDLYVLGGLDTTIGRATAVPETEWRRYGIGTVSADGLWIDSDADAGGIPAFNWIGYKIQE